MHSPKVSSGYLASHILCIHVDPDQAFHAEKASWRAVIQLNVVQSIHGILDLISKAHAASSAASSSASTSSRRASTSSLSAPSPTATIPIEYPPLTPEHLKLKMRLAPLIQVEAALIRRLLPPDQVEGLSRSNLTAPPFHQEISVNSSTGWKNTFNRLLRNPSGRDSCDSMDLINWSDPDDPGVVLHACSEDMIRLWADPTVRKLMEVEKMRPEEMAGLCVMSVSCPLVVHQFCWQLFGCTGPSDVA